MAAQLIERTCVACAKTDTDPKHLVGLPDGSEFPYHLDCHAAASAGYWGEGPCPSCTAQLADFTGQGGKALRTHILGGN